MKNFFKNFWDWYNKYLLFSVGISAGLLLLQIFHLYWLGTHIVFHKIFGFSIWNPSPFLEWILVVVDYTEIPALFSASLFYINELRIQKDAYRKNLLYLIFINVQFLHIFWITDEVVEARLTGGPQATILPSWLAYTAIAIDYLELPVIYETLRKFFIELKKKNFKKAGKVFTKK